MQQPHAVTTEVDPWTARLTHGRGIDLDSVAPASRGARREHSTELRFARDAGLSTWPAA